jgi:hypothetical protein
MLVSNDPRPISRTNIVKICARYISTHFLVIRFLISGEYSSENSFLCFLKHYVKRSWTYITLCELNVLLFRDLFLILKGFGSHYSAFLGVTGDASK